MSKQRLFNPNERVITQVIRNIQATDNVPAGALKRAIQMRKLGGSVDDWINAVAVFVSCERGELPEVNLDGQTSD